MDNNNNSDVRLKHKTVLFVAFVDSSKNSVSYIFIFVMGPFEEVQQISYLSMSSVSTQTLCFIMTPYKKTFLYALFIIFLTFIHFFLHLYPYPLADQPTDQQNEQHRNRGE